MLRRQWLMQTASWVWSLDLNLPRISLPEANTKHAPITPYVPLVPSSKLPAQAHPEPAL